MRYLILFFSVFLATLLHGQQETLFSNVDEVGAFGGPFIEIGEVNGQVTGDVGGGGALILDEFFLGGYGQGTDFGDALIDNVNWNVKYGHGGLWFGYVREEQKLLHLYSSLKLGWGRVRLNAENEDGIKDRIFVITPEIGGEVNITDFFKISVTGGYRLVNGAAILNTLDNSDFSSFIGTINFRFGGFSNDW